MHGQTHIKFKQRVIQTASNLLHCY